MPRPMRILLSLTVATMLIAAGTSPDVLAGTTDSATPETDCFAESQTAHLDLPYARTASDPNLTAVDIYEPNLPEGCPAAPILFYVHGGGWQTGDKARQLAGKRQLALERGWVLVSVNYRLVPEVVYPVPNQDVADAIGWTLDHAVDFHADPQRVAIMGHSAGGGIIAAVATDGRYLERTGYGLTDLDCAVSLDTEGYDIAARAGDGGIYDAMFGTDPSAWPDASPITHIEEDTGIPEFFIVTRGGSTRVAYATDFADTLAAAGVPVELIDVDLTHAGVNAAIGDPSDTQIMPELFPFLDACFA